MDCDYVTRLDEDIDWFFDNIDLSAVRKERTININGIGANKDILIDSIGYATSLITFNPGGLDTIEGHRERASYIQYIISGDVTIPPKSDNDFPEIAAYSLTVQNKKVTMYITWTNQITTTVSAAIDKRTLLKVFSAIRSVIPRVYDNLPGLLNYRFEFDLINNTHSIKFEE